MHKHFCSYQSVCDCKKIVYTYIDISVVADDFGLASPVCRLAVSLPHPSKNRLNIYRVKKKV